MHLQFLASEELGGRYTLSPNFAIAARYLASHLEAYGFKGAGEHGDFLQTFQVVSGKPDAVKSSLEVSFGGQAKSYHFGDFYIPGEGGNGEAQGQIVFVGTGISSSSQHHDDYAGLDVKRKIVLVVPGMPPDVDISRLDQNEYGQAAARGALDPLVGREEELARIIQVLCRRTRNNPVLIGEPGVGKTALVEGLANKIVQGDVPIYLAEKRILALDISLIVAGTKYRGQFEERLKTIMRELTESHNIIIFIDELHTLVGAGSAEGSLDAANILKPALSRGEIQCIGATTPAEYRKYIEKDRSLERRFQAVKVASPTEEETIQILRGIKDRYEKFHHVTYRDEALEAAVYQSSRYITDRFLPDKAIDLLDEAGSRVKLRDAAAPEEVPEFSRKASWYSWSSASHLNSGLLANTARHDGDLMIKRTFCRARSRSFLSEYTPARLYAISLCSYSAEAQWRASRSFSASSRRRRRLSIAPR